MCRKEKHLFLIVVYRIDVGDNNDKLSDCLPRFKKRNIIIDNELAEKYKKRKNVLKKLIFPDQ